MPALSSAETPSPSSPGRHANTQAWSLVLALTLCNVMAQIDRFAMTLLITPMQQDLGLNDTQTGLVGGLVTGVFYALAGLPLARVADQFNRRWLIIFGVLGWSLMTMASGLAVGFWTLCLARMLLSVGDAALGPAANSMIANVFPPERLAKPLSVFAAAGSVGNALASLLVAGLLALAPWAAGWLSFQGQPMAPWRIVMLGLGLVGVLPLIAMLMVAEPRRHTRPGAGAPNFRAFLRYLKPRRQAFGTCYLGYALFVLPFVALQFWLPTAYERVHGIPTTTVGVWLGLGYLLAGAPGTLFGGWLAEHLERRGRPDGKLLVLMIAALAAMPATLLSQWVGDARLGTAFVWLAMFCAAMALGPVTAAIQALAVDEFRAQAAALLYLLIFIVAFMGIPLAGVLSDHVFGDPKRLGTALSLISLLFCTVAALLVARGRHAYLQALGQPGRAG